jgi:methionyl aminopeptidase
MIIGDKMDDETENEEDNSALMKELGKVSVAALQKARSVVKAGARILDVAETVESFIKDKGYGLSFPINISINERAAHYTPSFDDAGVFAERDVVKLDLGAEKDGMLGDIALTVDLSQDNQELVDASREALENAMSMVRAGARVRDIGREIGSTIEKHKFRPIANLGGHGMGKNGLHTGLFIPNYDNGDDSELEEDMMIAIEPFATTGKGFVTDIGVCEIYELSRAEMPRSQDARILLGEIMQSYSKNPFALRWLSHLMDSKFRLYAAMHALVTLGIVEPYPVLVEVTNGLVSQTEAQMLVQKDSCDIIAMPEK